MTVENQERGLGRFLNRYRTLWFVLFIGALVWAPLATLNFVSVLTWVTPPIALFSWLATFVLGLTVFVAGKWDNGFVNLQTKKQKAKLDVG
jgi:hypothetical protein